MVMFRTVGIVAWSFMAPAQAEPDRKLGIQVLNPGNMKLTVTPTVLRSYYPDELPGMESPVPWLEGDSPLDEQSINFKNGLVGNTFDFAGVEAAHGFIRCDDFDLSPVKDFRPAGQAHIRLYFDARTQCTGPDRFPVDQDCEPCWNNVVIGENEKRQDFMVVDFHCSDDGNAYARINSNKLEDAIWVKSQSNDWVVLEVYDYLNNGCPAKCQCQEEDFRKCASADPQLFECHDYSSRFVV